MHIMNKTKGKKGYFSIKVDLSGAYDKLSWEYIWRILREINKVGSIFSVFFVR